MILFTTHTLICEEATEAAPTGGTISGIALLAPVERTGHVGSVASSAARAELGSQASLFREAYLNRGDELPFQPGSRVAVSVIGSTEPPAFYRVVSPPERHGTGTSLDHARVRLVLEAYADA